MQDPSPSPAPEAPIGTTLPVAYDSRQDTVDHILRVAELLNIAAGYLRRRGNLHDASKLIEPEKSAFDRLGALKLSHMKYGTPEYMACLSRERSAIAHHYSVNSHHPANHDMGVAGMTLLDLVEMLMDWKAASERMEGGGDILQSIEFNATRFSLSPQLKSILLHTVKEMRWT